MSNIPLDTLLDHAGSDYDDLPADVQAMCDEVDTDLAAVGVDVDADLKATDAAEAPVEIPNGTVTSFKANRDKGVPESFASRGKARAYVSSNPGYKVVDNGAGASSRWTVASTGGTSTVAVKSKTKKPNTATATVTPAAASKKTVDKKAVAITVYRELEAKDELKRSTFLAEMDTRVGLSAKGASSYFYRIKGGKW